MAKQPRSTSFHLFCCDISDAYRYYRHSLSSQDTYKSHEQYVATKNTDLIAVTNVYALT